MTTEEQSDFKKIRNQIISSLIITVILAIGGSVAGVKMNSSLIEVNQKAIEHNAATAANNTNKIEALKDNSLSKEEFIRYMDLIRADISNLRQTLKQKQ